MTSAAGGCGRTRLPAALLLGVLALLLAAVPAVSAQEPPPAAPADASLELVDRPAWARPTDQLLFALDITGDPAALTVQVEVFSALDSVEELVESGSEDVGVRLSRTPPAPVDSLFPGPGGTRLVALSVAPEPVDGQTTQLVEPGVHPVVISLLGPGGEVLDEVRTPLVRLGDEDDPWEAPDLAVLLDVGATPTLQADGTRSVRAAELAALTRTAALLAAHPDLDLTIAAVPDTLEALVTLTDPAPEALLAELAGRDVLGAPYLPLAVAELVEHGLDGLLGPLLERGTGVLADQLGIDPRPGVWHGTEAPGAAGARALRDLGFERLVVTGDPAADGEDDDPPDEETDPFPLLDSGPRPVAGAGSLLGVVVDPVLSAELAAPLPDRADAAHLALARLLLRPVEADPGAGEEDDDGADDRTTVLVRPGPLPERSTLAGLLGLLDDPSSPVRAGGLDLVDAEADQDDDEELPAAPITWPDAAAVELGPVAPRVAALATRIEGFAALVRAGSPRTDDVRLQVATAVAATTPAARRDDAVAAAEVAIDDAFTGVRLGGQATLNLTSRRGTLPVTVENANPFPVDVLVRVRSDRLAFPDGAALTLSVEPAEQRRIDIPVEARATGSVPVFVELWTPDDRTQLTVRRLNVRSTAFSGVGLVLSFGAVAVLVAWWVRHSLAVRRARAAGSGHDAAPME